MNLNLLAYGIYLSIMALIIVKVGKVCYDNGNVFVSALIPDHEDLCHRANQILLIGYYLLNLGYCAMTLISWKTIGAFPELVEAIALKSSVIICTVAIMHYINIILLTKYIKKLI